jgi:phosphoribosylformylglycinamidine synthase subunit PurQ / glutaminase
MKFGVIVFPGSNCDQDVIHALQSGLGQPTVKLWHKDRDLQGCDFIVVPGGFSYGDYLRSGAIARFSPIMDEVIAHANRGGYVMGICNGFQILTEAGLLEGGLLRNNNQRFICKNVWIKPANNQTLLTQKLDPTRAYRIPIAHAEGRYYAPENTLKSILDNDQVLFHYTNQEASIEEQYNPNGSMLNIAGIANKQKNVFGMMPHPERAADILLGNTDGKSILESILA